MNFLSYSLVSALVVLAGCNFLFGGDCRYDDPVTGQVTVTSIEPSSGSCVDVAYAWTTNGPARFANFDHFFADANCLEHAGIMVDSTFEVVRQEMTHGTCTPSIRTITTDDVAECEATCP